MNKKASVIFAIFFMFVIGVFSQDLKFKDSTANAGLSLIDNLGGHGTATGDINNDGWVDFIISNSYNPQFVYINQKDGTFSLKKISSNLLTHQTLLADVDNDGDLDLVFSNAGDGEHNRLYINDGKGNFSYKTSPINNSEGGTRGITSSDFNNDGLLDIYTVNFKYPNQLFINQGNASFIEKAESWGARDYEANKSGSQGVVSADINNDGLQDIFISKYKYNTSIDQKPILFINHGTYFVNEAEERHIYSVNLNGATFVDLDNDGDLDLILAKQKSNTYLTIYKNNNGYFQDMTNILKIPLIHKELFSIIAGDLNNDGLQDILVVGWYSNNKVYINKGNWNFVSVSTGIEDYYRNGRSGSLFDYDNDGDLDVLITGYAEHTKLYENLLNNDNKAIEMEVYAPNGQKAPYGTKILLYKNSFVIGKPWQTKYLISTQGYLSQISTRTHFGIGKEQNLSLKIIYNTGEEKYLFNVVPGSIFNVGNIPEINVINSRRVFDRGFLIRKKTDVIDISIPSNVSIKKIYVYRKQKGDSNENYEKVGEFSGDTNQLVVSAEDKDYNYAIFYTTEDSVSFVTFFDINRSNE